MTDKCKTFVARWDHAMCSTCGEEHSSPAPTPAAAAGVDLDAVEEAEHKMTPGPWEAKIYTTHVAGTPQETQWHEAIAGGPSSGTVVCETEWSVFEDESAIGAANIRGIVALRNAAPALIAEVRALRAKVAEAKRLGMEACATIGCTPERSTLDHAAAIAVALEAL